MARAVLLKLPATATKEAMEQFKRAVAHKELINPINIFILNCQQFKPVSISFGKWVMCRACTIFRNRQIKKQAMLEKPK